MNKDWILRFDCSRADLWQFWTFGKCKFCTGAHLMGIYCSWPLREAFKPTKKAISVAPQTLIIKSRARKEKLKIYSLQPENEKLWRKRILFEEENHNFKARKNRREDFKEITLKCISFLRLASLANSGHLARSECHFIMFNTGGLSAQACLSPGIFQPRITIQFRQLVWNCINGVVYRLETAPGGKPRFRRWSPSSHLWAISLLRSWNNCSIDERAWSEIGQVVGSGTANWLINDQSRAKKVSWWLLERFGHPGPL